MITLSTSTPTVYGTVGVMKKLTPRTFVVRGSFYRAQGEHKGRTAAAAQRTAEAATA